MIAKKVTNVFLILSACIFLFGSGYKIGEYKSSLNLNRQKSSINSVEKKDNQVKNLDFSLFWEVWDKLEEKFIDKKKLDANKMYYGAIKGLVSALEDPYTFFMTPDENKQSKADLEGKFEGIGAQLGLKDNHIIIIAPLKGSPSETAGVKAGDFINKVDNESTKDWTLTKAVSKIRGPKGTKVKLTLERNQKELVTEITRDVIKIASVETKIEKKNDCRQSCLEVYYLKLNQFGDNTNNEWDNKVEEIKNLWSKKQIKGLVLDLRDNPGGYLDGSVYLASEFLPQGKLVVRQESTVQPTKNYIVERKGNLSDIPLVVLINKGSASASEILGGALRDYRRTVLVGEKTFGKGSVQEAYDLKNGAGLHITIAKWILPKGDWINSKGIEPDIKVENKIPEGNTLIRENDLQLEKAIDQLLK